MLRIARNLDLDSASEEAEGGEEQGDVGVGVRGGYDVHNQPYDDPKARNQITQLNTANVQHNRTTTGLKSEDAHDPDATLIDIENDAGNKFGGKSKEKKS